MGSLRPLVYLAFVCVIFVVEFDQRLMKTVLTYSENGVKWFTKSQFSSLYDRSSGQPLFIRRKEVEHLDCERLVQGDETYTAWAVVNRTRLINEDVKQYVPGHILSEHSTG